MSDAQEAIGALLDLSGGRDLTPAETATEVERELLKHDQIDIPVVHHFFPGIYVREAHFPPGTLAVGHCHKTEHMNVLLKGRITVINGDGTKFDVCAPAMFHGRPGKKMAYIHEETIWQNLHATEERDLDKLEAMLIEKSDAWIEHHANELATLKEDKE